MTDEKTKPFPVFDNRKDEIIMEICILEANQARAVREAALGNPTRLQEIDDKIVALRNELKDIEIANAGQSVS